MHVPLASSHAAGGLACGVGAEKVALDHVPAHFMSEEVDPVGNVSGDDVALVGPGSADAVGLN